MELSKQARAQRPPVPGSGAASSAPAAPTPAQRASHGMLYPGDNWGPQVPTRAYLIVPMGGQPAQVGASGPDAPRIPGDRPVSRVSLRPPQQVLSVQPALPGVFASQSSPSATGKKMAASPKVQRLKSAPSQVSAASKRSVQKEPVLKAYPQLSETVRSKFRETLAAALCVGSASNLSPTGSAGENKHADDDTLQRPSTCISRDDGKADTNSVPEFVGIISEQGDMSSSGISGPNMTTSMSKDTQQQSIHVPLENDASGNSTIISDELLQGHRLVWAPDTVAGASESILQLNSKRSTTSDIDCGATVSLYEPGCKRTKTSDGVTWEKKGIIQKGQILALRIEEELFKLFGGVNKKYKEKGRSLLFNLKDKSNPILRERVLSGEITPKCLCSMTTEELASKELSAWRLAKAEELAKMVELPNREVNVRRLVRKTHKGEFHVDVKESNGISVEVELGGDLLSHVPSKSIEGRTKSDNRVCVHRVDKEPDKTVQDGVAAIGKSNLLSNLECLADKKTDLNQEHLVDDLKDADNLPEIMSLDEFVDAPDSDIPFEYHCTETAEDDSSFADKAYITLKPETNHITEDNAAPSEFEFTCDAPSLQDNCQAKLELPQNGSIPNLGPAKQPKGGLSAKSFPEKMDAEKLDTASASISGSTMQSKATSDATLTHGWLWEGTIQFTLSSRTNVVAIFKSGEKPSTNEWRHFVEIKGRVRLTVFQEFLEQLPKSRSRAVMVTELRWKEDSVQSGWQHLLQIINSYIADDRVGLVNPAKGVDLYLCPSQGKAAQILADHLPKEHLGSLTVTGVSVIGVVVWRRARVSTEIPTRYDASKIQSMSISRKQQAVISSLVPMPCQLAKPPASHFGFPNGHRRLEDDATDKVPPGFGPGVVKDVFVSISNTSANVATSHAYRTEQPAPATSLPVDQVRELVRRYGKRYCADQPWDDDDDIPEWDPAQSNPRQTWHQQPLLPPPAPGRQLYPYEQQQYHVAQQLTGPLSQAYVQPQHVMTVQQPLTYQHLMQPAHDQSGWHGWRPSAQWCVAGTPAEDVQQACFVAEPETVSTRPMSLGAREPWLGSWKTQ